MPWTRSVNPDGSTGIYYRVAAPADTARDEALFRGLRLSVWYQFASNQDALPASFVASGGVFQGGLYFNIGTSADFNGGPYSVNWSPGTTNRGSTNAALTDAIRSSLRIGMRLETSADESARPVLGFEIGDQTSANVNSLNRIYSANLTDAASDVLTFLDRQEAAFVEAIRAAPNTNILVTFIDGNNAEWNDRNFSFLTERLVTAGLAGEETALGMTLGIRRVRNVGAQLPGEESALGAGPTVHKVRDTRAQLPGEETTLAIAQPDIKPALRALFPGEQSTLAFDARFPHKVVAALPGEESALDTFLDVFPTLPAQFVEVTISDIDFNDVRVSWIGPTNDVDYDVNIRVRRSGETDWQFDSTIPSSVTSTVQRGLDAGATYELSIRGQSVETGAYGPARATTFTTAAPIAPTVPQLFQLTIAGANSLRAAWAQPANLGGAALLHYQVDVLDNVGDPIFTTDVDPDSTHYVIRGLLRFANYQVRVSAVNRAGASVPTETLAATPAHRAQEVTTEGVILPLLAADRQTFVVRLGEMDCTLSLWWQPWDSGWYASMEVPTNNPILTGKRVTLNGGLLDRLPDVLPGNIVCRGLAVSSDEPGYTAFATPTHAMVWEPN